MAKSQNPSGRISPMAHQANKIVKKQFREGKNCVRKFAFATRVGYHPHNPNKVNQDQYILAPNIQGLPAAHLFGICDGHGQYGREVSSYVKVNLAAQIEKRYGKDHASDIEGDDTTNRVPANIKTTKDPYIPLKNRLKECFLQVNKDIEANVPNCQFSGTTCSIVLTRGPQVISANSGDSRAIIVDKDGKCK